MITIISAWYNEEFLARLFLEHYRFADQIIILLDQSTNDGTIDIIKEFIDSPTYDTFISIRKLKMPNGFDDKLKQHQVNQQYLKIKKGWVIEVDADEFIYPPAFGLQNFLNTVEENIVKVEFWQMYQHKTESSLNKEDPIFKQRRYGAKNGLERWNKPCILRAGKGFLWGVGHHKVNARKGHFHRRMVGGAHWFMADIKLAIDRRLKGRRDRMSVENYLNNLSMHNFVIESEDIEKECLDYSECRLVFA